MSQLIGLKEWAESRLGRVLLPKEVRELAVSQRVRPSPFYALRKWLVEREANYLEIGPTVPAGWTAPVPTQLYRHYDAEGRLLYVGISLSAVVRLQKHNFDAHWSRNIARMDIEHFPSRDAALEAESMAIQSEKPLHNIYQMKRPPPKPPKPTLDDFFRRKGFRPRPSGAKA